MNIPPRTAALDQAITELVPFLRECHQRSWADTLTRIGADLRDEDSYARALGTLGALFGGMGSLNDIYICEVNRNVPAGHDAREANGELDRLLDNLFTAFQAARGLAVPAHKDLPPRYAYAFRRDPP